MEFAFNDQQRAVIQTARRFAQKELVPVAAEMDREQRFPIQQVRQAAKLGFTGMLIPAEYGGSNIGPIAYCGVIREIASGCGSTAVTLSVTNMVAETILKWGTEEQKRKYLPLLFSGQWPIGGFALTEPNAGSDASSITTRAQKCDDGYLLNGGKIFITSGDVCSVLIVYARTGPEQGSRGISAFIVERDAPGLVIGKHEQKMGLRASSTVQLSFEDCLIPVKNRLGDEGVGFKIALSALDGGRIGIASQSIGIGRAALAESVRYAKEREQFGRPIVEFQAVASMLADMATELEGAWLLTMRAASLKAAGKPSTRESAMAKLFASESANRACRKAVQVHGGYGYTADYNVERYMRDCKVTTIYEGTSEIQRLVIARHTLK